MSDLALLIVNEDRWATRRADRVDLARNDQAFELWVQADEVEVGDAEIGREPLTWLVVPEQDIAELS
ncbi:MAG: hypothetical protein R6X03_09515 [Methyloceanibacter sp.]